MNKKSGIILSISTLLSISLISIFSFDKNSDTKIVKGYSVSSLPTTIDLNAPSEATIRNYYSNLNSLSQSERQGTNLLKNLKTILKNGQKYFSYDSGNAIWQMYEITDRDWELSPASDLNKSGSATYGQGTYNATTNVITNYKYGKSTSNYSYNPYIRALYFNRSVTNQATAWSSHGDRGNAWTIEREHVWPKSQGFETSGSGGARGDPMHLIAANGTANGLHSNHPYGYINLNGSNKTDAGSTHSNVAGNYTGTSLTIGSGTVFEPQDSDKGDIARSIFYMVARYNYLSGSDSDGIGTDNPNLELVQAAVEKSSYTSSTTEKGQMGILSDLLAWHHADPVDEYEIKRNNLLYVNFTKNRNPFIDFPEWVDYIWGTATYNGRKYQSYSSTPTGYATPSSDTINGYNSSSSVSVTGVSLDKTSLSLSTGSTYQLTATISPNNASNKSVTWSSNKTSVATVSSSGVITAKSVGNATITVTTADGGYSATCNLTVQSGNISVTGVSLDKLTLSLSQGDADTLIATITPSNATNKNVTWSSDNTSVATVSGGQINAIAEGTATITITTSDGGYSASCVVTVSASSTSSITKYSGSLTEGDYVIVYENGAVKNTISSSRLSYSEVTITGDTIDSVDSSVVWHIAPSGNYWTIYNAESNSYLASTGTKNQATLASSIDDKALWTASGNSTYEFVNKHNNTNSVNANLRRNGTYGFACYSTSTGGALSLYKITGQLPDISVTSISLDKTTLYLTSGSTRVLTATISPTNATNQDVEWESSDYDIVDVDTSGNIVALSEGTATITVTTDDGGFTASCVITVTSGGDTPTSEYSLTKGSPYMNGVPYKMYFSRSGTNNYFTGEIAYSYYGATSSTKSFGINVYFEQNGNGQNIYMIKDGVNNYLYLAKSGDHINFKFDSTTVPENAWVYNSTYGTMGYTLSATEYAAGSVSTYPSFGAYTIGTTTYPAKFEVADNEGATTFATILNDYIVCNSSGNSAPTFSNFSWSEFEDVYSNLSSADKSTLAQANPHESGSEVEQFVARYDYIVGKYSYNDFLGRNPSPIGNSRVNLFILKINDENNLLIIILTSITILSSFTLYLVIKKRKEKSKNS